MKTINVSDQVYKQLQDLVDEVRKYFNLPKDRRVTMNEIIQFLLDQYHRLQEIIYNYGLEQPMWEIEVSGKKSYVSHRPLISILYDEVIPEIMKLLPSSLEIKVNSDYVLKLRMRK